MRRVAIALCGASVSALVAVVAAQQTPTFRAGVTLITVDVSVLDRNGKPVPGLAADDFEVKLDGHVQPVRVVTYQQMAPPPVAPVRSSGAPTRETTNAPPASEPRLFVVLLDDLSIAPSRGKRMTFAADRFIKKLSPSDIVGFTTTSGTTTVNPTLDHAAVQAAVRHTVGEFIDPRDTPLKGSVGIVEALEVYDGNDTLLREIIGRDCFGGRVATPSQLADDCATEVARKVRTVGMVSRQTASRQIGAYINVINAMRQAPGLKQLVMISDGLGVSSRQGLDLEPIARAAAEAGVQLSVLVEEPDIIGADDSAGSSMRDDNQALVRGIQTVADMTGGNFYRVIAAPDPFFDRVADASSAIYHLGVEAPAGSVPGRDFALAARVRRSGVTVHANRHAVAPAAAVVVPVDEQLHDAVAKGLPFYGVPLSIATVLRRGNAAGQLDLGANVEIPAGIHGPLTVVFGLVDNAGTLRTGRKAVEAPAGGSAYRVALSLPVVPGQYHLRFAVADAAGHIGSIDAPVSAQLARVGPFEASDLLTSWSGPDGTSQFLALEAVPSAATRLRTFLELYSPAAGTPPADVRVDLALLGSDAKPIDDRSVMPATATDRLTATAEFALDALAPGTYTIRATVLVGGRGVGTVSTTIRKTAKSMPAEPVALTGRTPSP